MSPPLQTKERPKDEARQAAPEPAPAPDERAQPVPGQARYLLLLFVVPLVLMAATIAFNALVDPLWYFAGNQLTGRTFPWNERYSKINLYLRHAEKYDCVIFGSSRAALLDPANIPGYTCFNFGFANGTVKDYVAYLRYVLDHSEGRIRMVVVGVDGLNLLAPEKIHEEIPDFIRTSGSTPGIVLSYISPKFVFSSLKTLFDEPDGGIYYTTDFAPRLVPVAHHWTPPDLMSAETVWDPGIINNMPIEGFTTRSAALFRQIRELVPRSIRLIGYAPPVYAKYIAYLRLIGTMPDYLDASYAAAKSFDEYYDFTVPSHWTHDPKNATDFEHFVAPVNDEVAKVMFGGARTSGIAAHEHSREEYEKEFLDRTDRYIRQHGIGLVRDAALGATTAKRD